MKKITLLMLTILMSIGSIFAQNSKSTKSSISTSISDYDDELSISIKGTINGKYINFDHTYNVENFSKKEKDKLIRSVGDSLGINLNHDPLPPLKPISPMPPLDNLHPLEVDGIGVYSESHQSGRIIHFSSGMAEIRVTCEKCPSSGTISLKSDDNKSHVTYSFQEEDKDVFPLIFKSQPGKHTFKYNFGETSYSETLFLKKSEVISKKLK